MILEKQFHKVYIPDIEVAFSCLTSRTTMLSLSEIVAPFKYFFTSVLITRIICTFRIMLFSQISIRP